MIILYGRLKCNEMRSPRLCRNRRGLLTHCICNPANIQTYYNGHFLWARSCSQSGPLGCALVTSVWPEVYTGTTSERLDYGLSSERKLHLDIDWFWAAERKTCLSSEAFCFVVSLKAKTCHHWGHYSKEKKSVFPVWLNVLLLVFQPFLHYLYLYWKSLVEFSGQWKYSFIRGISKSSWEWIYLWDTNWRPL